MFISAVERNDRSGVVIHHILHDAIPVRAVHDVTCPPPERESHTHASEPWEQCGFILMTRLTHFVVKILFAHGAMGCQIDPSSVEL